jgi:tripartite-type tricarboxylate transporter receptor subunit TctC
MRLIAPALSQALGQNIIVENKPGASGIIASTIVVKAKPDGHTMLVTSAIQGALNKHFHKPPYDPNKDLVAIAALAAGPNVLVIGAAQPFKSVQDLVVFAKSNPNKLTFASNGQGSGQHMVGELFNQLAGTQITHVPFKGSGEYLSQIIGNNVTMGFASTLSTIPLISAGKLRALGVTTRTRVDSLPDIPAISEYKPMSEFRYVNWVGLFTTAGTPSSSIALVNKAVATTLQDPGMANALRARGNDPVIMSVTEVQEYVESEAARITKLAIERNIQIGQ